MTDKKELAVTEGNKLIAEFMGEHFIEFHEMICRCDPDSGSPWGYDPIQWLTYERDWSELMPVVKKIQQLEIQEFNNKKPVMSSLMDVDIDTLWQSVVVFIQWYNNQTPTK